MKLKVYPKGNAYGIRLYATKKEAEACDLKEGEILDVEIKARWFENKKVKNL